MTDSSSTNTRSMFTRGLIAIWKFIDGTRKLFLNLLFLGILVLLVSALMDPEQVQRLQPQTTLVLQPLGEVVDEYSTTALDRALQNATGQIRPETRLRDLLETVYRAADDPDISQMLIDTDYLWGIGLSSLLDLATAIEHFKASGKPVVAMGDGLGQHQYYLAALADEVWLNPTGMVWLDGYANYRNYYREGLEKLSVEVNLFRAGEYKSAMEPWIRNDMSPEEKEASLYWMGGLWQQYLEGISRQRGIPVETLARAIGELPAGIEDAEGDFASWALRLGLVDALRTRPEARQELARRGAANEEGDSFRGVDSDTYLELTNHQRLPNGTDVVVLAAEGEMVTGLQQPGQIGSETLGEQLREIARRSDVKALVLRINSPGGDSMAAEQIRREIQALRDGGKTVVVSMGDVAASGGYWIAMGVDEVWASPATITGSIGVYGMLPTFGGTLNRLGIHSDGVGTTPLAGKLRLDRPLDPDLKRIFQASTENIYADFITLVSEARGMSPGQVDEVARGRVWSGSQAVERGLVDRLGSLQDAVDAAARIAGLGTEFGVSWYEPELSPFEAFLLDLSAGVAVRLGVGTEPAWARTPLVQQLLTEFSALARSDGRFSVAAWCPCNIR